MAGTVDFGSTKGAHDIKRLGPPMYDLTIAGPPNISVRVETATIPHKSGGILIGDGLLEPASLVVSGKMFLLNRGQLDAASYSIWSDLYGGGEMWVRMSNGSYNYPVILKGVSGEFVRDTGDKWGNLTINLLILDPSLIAA